MKYDIFISYRREGGEALACFLYEKLKNTGCNVFYDVSSLRQGKYDEKLLEVIKECKDVIVILSPESMKRCCESDNDWVRKEISTSLMYGKNIVPVKMRSFEWPMELPEEIKAFRKINYVTANMEYFDASYDKILSMLTTPQSMSLINRSYWIVYYSFLELMDKKRIVSKITFTESGTIMFNNVREATGKFDYEYTGYTKEEDSNIFIHLKNKHSLEQVEISLVKSVGELDRYIGLFMATSPVLAPVCMKVAMVNEKDISRINDNILKKVLSHDNKEWNNDILTIESSTQNIFFSDLIFQE